jgi:hypothetical protein
MREQAKKIVTTFKDSLDYQLQWYTNMRSYLDVSRLKGGQFFNAVLAENLCQSVCMVALYWPTYFDATHPYCAREYRGMEMLEQRRKQLLPPNEHKDGLIIPVIFKGADYLPKYVKTREYYDFSGLKPWDPPLYRHRKYENKFDELARYIAKLCARFAAFRNAMDPCNECSDSNHPNYPFCFPSEADIAVWLDQIIGPHEDQVPYPLRAA